MPCCTLTHTLQPTPATMPLTDLKPGLVLSKKWKLGKLIGSGAFGAVYEGR